LKDRKQALEAFAKQLKEGLPFAEGLIDADNDVENNALLARNLSEQTLAHEVMKNTGVPVPGKGSSTSQKEDFLNRIMKERYPELEPNIQVKNIDGAAGTYGNGVIEMDKILMDHLPLHKNLATTLHEAGHQYDDQILGFRGKELDLKTLRDLKKQGFDLKNADPAQVYELYSKGHHAQIPDLREGSFGLGALKSYLKSGNFKSLAGPVAGLGLGAAMMPEDASASDFIPGLDQAENAGSAMDDKMMQTEVRALDNYKNSPAAQARRDALRRIRGR
jgi:hypothetical protein